MRMIEKVAEGLGGWEFATCADENPDCPGGMACPKNTHRMARGAVESIRDLKLNDGVRAKMASHFIARGIPCPNDLLVDLIDTMIDAALTE